MSHVSTAFCSWSFHTTSVQYSTIRIKSKGHNDFTWLLLLAIWNQGISQTFFQGVVSFLNWCAVILFNPQWFIVSIPNYHILEKFTSFPTLVINKNTKSSISCNATLNQYILTLRQRATTTNNTSIKIKCGFRYNQNPEQEWFHSTEKHTFPSIFGIVCWLYF